MADEDTLTSNAEPGETLTSTATEPEPASDADLSTSPQPTLEEVIAERDRLRGAVKGSNKLSEELKAEKERRERTEFQLQQLQQQRQYQPPPVPEPTDEDLAGQLNDAILEQDRTKVAKIQAIQQKRTEDRIFQKIGQAAIIGQQQTSFGTYLNDAGMKTGTPLYNRALEIQKELQNDPRYSFTGGNQNWIASIAAERAIAENTAKKSTAMETGKMETAIGAGSESGSKGSGAPPGKTPVKREAIYLTAEEKKKAEKWFGGSPEAAHKKFWEGMDSWKRDQRVQAGRAIV